MLDNERADRLEDKIDAVQKSISELNAVLSAHIARSNTRMEMVEDYKSDIDDIKGDLQRGKGAIGFLSFITMFLSAIAGIFVIFKK